MYQADFTIQATDGTSVPLLFNNWCFREFSYRVGVELEELYPRVDAEGKAVVLTAFRAKNYPTLLLVAAETYARYNHKEFAFSDLNACDWLDNIGGFFGKGVEDISLIMFAKLTNVPKEQLLVMVKAAANAVEDQKPAKKKHSR